MDAKASTKALEWLWSKNVIVLLDQTVDLAGVSAEDRVFTTSAGETVAADCHFVCTRHPVASGWLRESLLRDYVDEDGRLAVDEHLAQRHAMVMSRNLRLLVKGAREQNLHRYKASKAAITVTLGRRDALSELPFMTVVGHLPGAVKPRDLFIARTRRMMGLKSQPNAHAASSSPLGSQCAWRLCTAAATRRWGGATSRAGCEAARSGQQGRRLRVLSVLLGGAGLGRSTATAH